MKKIIPQVVQWYCDRCKAEIPEHKIDCTGSFKFVARDISGHAVGGTEKRVDLCSDCSFSLQKFFEGKAVNAHTVKKTKTPSLLNKKS